MLNDIIKNLPDGRAENELVQHLKQHSELEKGKIVLDLLQHDSDYVRASMLKITPRVIRDKDLLYKILEMGLAKKNVSGIKIWFKATTSGLGYKRMLNHMKIIAESHPEWIAHAWYQLVPLIQREAPECLDILDEIKNITDSSIQDELNAFWVRNKDAVPY